MNPDSGTEINLSPLVHVVAERLAICGLAYACWVAIAGIVHGRLSVDVIALLALAGAIAVDELLAATSSRSPAST